MIEIPLRNSELKALIDDDDFPLVSQYSWRLEGAGYAYATVNHKWCRLHVFVTQVLPNGIERHHKEGNKLNCQRSNIEFLTRHEHIRTRALMSRNTSGYKGVNLSTSSGKPWMSRIHACGRTYYLGTFNTAEEAARAYDAKARELFGPSCYLNFP